MCRHLYDSCRQSDDSRIGVITKEINDSYEIIKDLISPKFESQISQISKNVKDSLAKTG